MPVLHPAELWQRTGRYDIDELFKLQDRNEREIVLAMTHEEIVALHASHEIRSYRDLPQIWYHIQTKERDEPRPQGGVLRTREFIMKDSYTLDRDEEGLDEGYAKHMGAYDRIFAAAASSCYMVESDVGMMGGSWRARVHGAVRAPARTGRAAARAATTPPTSRWRVSRIAPPAFPPSAPVGRGRDA